MRGGDRTPTVRPAGERGKPGSPPARDGAVFTVHSAWRGGVRSDADVYGDELDGVPVARRFRLAMDCPFELGGENTAPGAEEHLLAALNGALTARHALAAEAAGVVLTRLTVRSPAADCSPRIEVVVQLAADAPPERLRALHRRAARGAGRCLGRWCRLLLDLRLVLDG